MRPLPWLLLVAGCYQPIPPLGAPCSTAGGCPRGQVCIADLCQKDGTASPDGAADSAVPPVDVAADASTWGLTEAVPGAVNTGHEDDPSWTTDRLTIVFARDIGDGNHELFIGTRSAVTADFTVTALSALNAVGIGDKSSPEISPDGTAIYFTADADGDGSHDVYKSLWIGDHWGDPGKDALSDPWADDGDVAISPDGLTAMLARDGHMWMATRSPSSDSFATPLEVPSLWVAGNTNVAAPSITNHADLIYFHSGEQRLLYFAQRNGDTDTFTDPVPIHELNLGTRNAAPFISDNKRFLLFARDNNIYSAMR